MASLIRIPRLATLISSPYLGKIIMSKDVGHKSTSDGFDSRSIRVRDIDRVFRIVGHKPSSILDVGSGYGATNYIMPETRLVFDIDIVLGNGSCVKRSRMPLQNTQIKRLKKL